MLWNSAVPSLFRASRSDLSVAEATIRAYYETALTQREADRRSETDRRRRIYDGDWRDLVIRQIESVTTPAVANAIMGSDRSSVDCGKNPARAIWDELAVLYNGEAIRTTDDETSAALYSDLVGDSFDDFWANVDRALEQYNDVVLWPYVTYHDGKPTIRHRWAAGNVMTVIEDDDCPDIAIGYVLVDSYTDVNGIPRSVYKIWSKDYHAVVDEKFNLLSDPSLVNPYGELPFIAMHRVDNQLSFFSPSAGSDIVDGTINIAVLRTQTNYLWKMASHKQLVAVGDDVSNIKTLQLLDPGVLLRIETSGSVQIVDWTPDFAARRAYVEAEESGYAASRGINPESLKRTANYQGVGAARRAERALTEARRRKAKKFRSAEREYYRKACLVAAHAGMDGVPDPMATLYVEHAPIDYPDDPMAQLEYEIKAASVGASSALQMILQRDPSLSREQAMRRLLDNLEVTAQIAEIKASRKVPNDLSNESALSETDGSVGPVARDNQSDLPIPAGEGNLP